MPPFIAESLAPLWKTISYLSDFAIYWVPPALLFLFIKLWLMYVRTKWRAGLEWALLEVKLPREINKSPQAMELALNALHQTTAGSKLDQWFKGRVRAWFSLELVSIEGRIHFFIYTQRFFVDYIMAQIYAQYPEVEIQETDDYTKFVKFNTEDSEWDLFGTEFKFEKPDPYPIKTYIDYELDKEVKDDRTRVNPLTPVLEVLGSLGPGEQMWIQIPVQAAKDRFHKKGTHFKKESWKDQGIELIKDIRKAEAKPGQTIVYSTRLLSPGEENLVKSIERSISKPGFDCGLRVIYLAKKGDFKPIRIASLIGFVKQFNASDRNGFKKNDDYTTDFDYPWQDFGGIRLAYRKRVIFNAYKKRSYFYPPYERKPMTLSAEELATVFHFPGAVAETPTLSRIPSKTGEPPRNLPRG
jgi:hypothetical protein